MLTGKLVVLLVAVGAVAAGKCKVSKVRAICEAHCEKDTRAVDRIAVPPPGTLMPPTGMFVGVPEGRAPASLPQNSLTQADISDNRATSLLEIESVSSEKGAISCDEVEAHIAPVQLLSWTDARTASFGCVDGRTTEQGLGAWGGDFAEFVMGLNVYEQMATLHLSQADVTSILRKYLESSIREKMTTCMSSQSAQQLFGSVEDIEAAVRSPAEDKVAAIWLKITDPNFIGNDHVKLMLQNPGEYAVRKELIHHAIRSFFDILWNTYDPLREKLQVQILRGDHEERAVVSVIVPDFCLKQAHLAPLIAPRGPKESVAVVNDDAVQILRKELSVFFSRETTPIVRTDEMNKRLNVLGAGQSNLSKKFMFGRIPSYSARISQ